MSVLRQRVAQSFWRSGRPGPLLFILAFVTVPILCVLLALFLPRLLGGHRSADVRYTIALSVPQSASQVSPAVLDPVYTMLIPLAPLLGTGAYQNTLATLQTPILDYLTTPRTWTIDIVLNNQGNAPARGVRASLAINGIPNPTGGLGGTSQCRRLDTSTSQPQDFSIECDRLVPGETAQISLTASVPPLPLENARAIATEVANLPDPAPAAIDALVRIAAFLQCNDALLEVDRFDRNSTGIYDRIFFSEHQGTPPTIPSSGAAAYEVTYDDLKPLLSTIAVTWDDGTASGRYLLATESIFLSQSAFYGYKDGYVISAPQTVSTGGLFYQFSIRVPFSCRF